jgi:hypothetical protein
LNPMKPSERWTSSAVLGTGQNIETLRRILGGMSNASRMMWSII